MIFYHQMNSPLSHTSPPTIAETLCELCMPQAFCGLETVRKIAQWTLCALWEKKLTSVREKPHHAPCKQPNRGISVITPLPFGGGVGGGATSSWARNVHINAQWTLCALWEKNLPSELFMCCIIQWERSISHRFTQMNRTHKASQRH